MLAEAEKLRWLGLDMRPRWRRRVAVVATYALYGGAVWVHWAPVWMVLLWLLIASQVADFLGFVRDAYGMTAKVVQRVLFLLWWAGIAVAIFKGTGARFRAHGGGEFPALYMLAFFLLSDSVLGWNRLVDRGDRGWVAEAIRHQDGLSAWKCRRLARLGFATGLEGFAWYEYGVRFGKLTEEQKLEIEALRAENPRGKWMRARKTVLFDDERMRREENELQARVQKVMTWVLVVSAFVFTLAVTMDVTVKAETALAWVWTLAGLAVTLRQAIPLWTEADPREMVGELAVVGGV